MEEGQDDMSPIENTAAADTLTKLMVSAPPGGAGILAQEAAGQAQVVNQNSEWVQIPADLNGGSWQDFLDAGFELKPAPSPFEGGDVDPLFREAKLPKGWAFEGSSHSMWSYIVDAEGFQRCSLFYKAAFYDRNAHISWNTTPKTAAQEEAMAQLYDEGWSVMYPSVERDGPNVVVVCRPAKDYETPAEERTKRRRLVLAKDGTVTYDEQYDVTTEQALEDARR